MDYSYRESLVRQGVQKSDEDKLEAVLHKWIESQCSEVSWDNLIQVLIEVGLIDTAKEVRSYLQTNPEAIRKYNWSAHYE